jgi:hypothetical protein
MVIYDIVPYGDEIKSMFLGVLMIQSTVHVPHSFHSMGRGNCMASIDLREEEKRRKMPRLYGKG